MNEEQQLIRRIPHQPEFERTLTAIPLAPLGLHEKDRYETSEIGLAGYLQIIRKNLWLILGLTVLCTAATAVYMARKPDVYGAGVRVQIDLENNPGVGINGKPVVVSNPASAPDYFDTQLEILRGPGLIRRVVKTLDLEHNRAFFRPEGQRTTWQRMREMAGFDSSAPIRREPIDKEVLITSTVAPPTDREDLAEIKRLNPYVWAIQSGLEVEQVGRTRLVEIRYTHRDPQVAAKVVNAIAEAFVHANLEKMTETNASAASFLKKRIADLQAQIRNGEERLINYAREHQIISLDQNQNTVVERLNSLNRQLLSAENDLSLAEAAYRAALSPGAADALASNGTQSNIDSKLGDLRQRLAELRVEYTPKWPEIRVIEGQIAELEKQSEQSRSNRSGLMLKNLETRFLEAQKRERTVRAAFEQQRNETIAQNSAAVNYRILQGEIQTNQDLLNGLWQRFKENDVILAGTPNNIRVTDYANTPEHPVGPQRTRGVGLAFLFSLVFGVGLSFVKELSNNTVRTTSDVSRKVRLPTIGVVPKVKSWPNGGLLQSSKALLHLNQKRTPRPLLKDEGSDSRLGEVYRKLRTTVMLSKPGKTPKTLLITSSVPAEGKTTTAVNMATVLAQTGANVLIIDADMRQPTLHEIFDLDNKRGLSTLLASNFTEAETLSLIQKDLDTGLGVLTAGPVPPQPAELLSSDRMRRLLAIVSDSFTHVVIDSTPMVSFTDSVLIASLVDGVILVVQGGKSPYEIVQHSRKELHDVGANIYGVVLNNADVSAQDSYYYYQQPA
jgi:capsular exopolysaccharide synthesis family protein